MAGLAVSRGCAVAERQRERANGSDGQTEEARAGRGKDTGQKLITKTKEFPVAREINQTSYLDLPVGFWFTECYTVVDSDNFSHESDVASL